MQIVPEQQQLQRLLKQKELSVTATRQQIFLVMLNAQRPLTIQEIIRKCSSVNFVSVYRTIDTFLMIGVIKQVPIGFKNRYEVSDSFKPHHHHVTCEMCGKTRAIHNDAVEQLMYKITKETGMKPTRHHFEAYGVCDRCAI